MKRLALAIALIGPAALAGCEPAPIYNPNDHTPAVGWVTPPAEWRIGGTIRDGDLACDGKIETAAVAGAAPASMTIDLGKACTFNFVVIDHGREQDAFARRVQIATSLDGKTFTAQIVGPGARRVSNFLLRRPVLARYVRITAVESGPKPWAVAEVHLQ